MTTRPPGGASRDPVLPGFDGLADTSISAGEMLVTGGTRGGVAVVDRFSDDDYMVEPNVDLNSGSEADVYVRLRDRANGYRIRLTSGGTIKLQTGTNRTNRDPTNRGPTGDGTNRGQSPIS